MHATVTQQASVHQVCACKRMQTYIKITTVGYPNSDPSETYLNYNTDEIFNL